MRSWPPVSTTSVQMFSGFPFDKNASAFRCLFLRTAQYSIFRQFLLQAEGARGTEEVRNFQLCASSPWRAPKLSWKRITSSSWHNSVQSKAHFNPLSWWSAREGGHYRKGGRQAASKPSSQPPPHTPLSCIHFMCNATHTFSKDLLHFKLLENQKVSLLLIIKLCQSQFLK